MNPTDLKNSLTLTALSHVAARTSTVTGSAVDVRGYKGQLVATQAVGTVSGTTPTLNGKLQTSPDGTNDWTDISGATFTEVTAADSVQSIGVDVRDTLGYVRFVGTIAGTSPSFTMGALLQGTKERY